MNHRFPYEWCLKDGYPAKGISKNNLKVFGTFICGGGSTMGYKLAGFNHIGGVEIDPPIADVYKTNHKPEFLYNMDIRDFIKKDDIPAELYDLDILDGSPPCSTFSMAGSREAAWGKKKKFREGQKEQTLDDLFFEFIKLTNKLKPKVVIAENVKGMVQGNARAYVNEINKGFNAIGYTVQLFLLNAASMGVPQKRERVFFICSRKDWNFPKLKLSFNEEAIPFGKVRCGQSEKAGAKDVALKDKGSGFVSKTDDRSVHPTILGASRYIDKSNMLTNDNELSKVGSYPLDYVFKSVKPQYLIGMSVPPVMTAQVAHQIYLQWFR